MLSIISLLLGSCGKNDGEEAFLSRASDHLGAIKSATYLITTVSSAPGDTAKFSEPRTGKIDIYINPEDTLIGASSVRYMLEDSTREEWYYDGISRGLINWEKQYVKVDSFQDHPYPFRLVYYPMYVKVKEIIKYAFTTKDSIQTEFHDFGDSLRFRLSIFDKHIYFHTKPVVIRNDYIPEDEITRFEIWFRKSDELPYRMRSQWHHLTLFEEITKARVNTSKEVKFVATDIFPNDFPIAQFTREARKDHSVLEGQVAADWRLKDVDGNEVGLKDLDSKVVMIQFTGVGCGPCHHSLPFLKKLVNDYQHKSFELVAIETWSNNMEGLRRYQERNEFNFKFLKTTERVSNDYRVQAVPAFFILDEDRVIRKILTGYSEAMNEEIVGIINSLL
ncbi:MAG: TlpA disulfide reductase family protein [Saprospiraceae bacterium]|nr:TlpA family protein disulfide reductase [Lewinella sp.]